MAPRNTSYVLNNFTWGDQLLAGIGGSASRVNMLEPLQSAIPVIQNAPYAFQEGIPTKKETEEDSGLTGYVIPDTVVGVLRGDITGNPITDGAALLTKVTSQKFYEQIKEDAWGWFKTSAILLVCLILIIFGLAILLYPGAKTVTKEAIKVA